ncbi:hypothetical protein [Methylobacterium sp. WL9]|uniref:DUF6894 family protein n=1 Tax=Methylobacterium sp. WL9 TaxID=2603898 RepID=UPI0011D93573|nr:hypothetical protein [Methylobacterium sp. WL9]TXN23179.1 hypothetical protein FV217_07675 [Methylobacterium sp. WL9]
MGVNEIATPQFHIEVTSSEGAIVSPDPKGTDLDGAGAARALVVETLVGFTQERPLPGMTRTTTVTARDKNGGLSAATALRFKAVRYQDQTIRPWGAPLPP